LILTWAVHARAYAFTVRRANYSQHLEKETFPMAMQLTKNLGILLLGIWLILNGLIPLLNLSFAGLSMIMAILAIASGVFLLLGR
jgi:hypothetical protein